MMDYTRWLVFVKFRDFFDSGAFIPVSFLNLVVVGVLTFLFWPLGLTLIILSAFFWGYVIFLFAQRAWNANRAEYQKFLDKTK
jgi:hypothetical protein